jgi:hypothetical protein
VKSIETKVVRRVFRCDAKTLKERSQGVKVFHCVIIKGKKVLTHKVSTLSIREERLVVFSWLRDLLDTFVIQDDVQDQVVILLDGKGGWGSVPEVLLVGI